MRVLDVFLLALGLSAATLPDPSPAEIQQIIQKFAAKESEFSKARQSYIFKQITRMHEYNATRTKIIGKLEMNADWQVLEGKRVEKVTWAPPMSFQNLILEPEDLQDMRDTLPFVLSAEELDLYQVDYLGHETVDELDCYVFSVKPKRIESGKRYFSGVIWVDDQDLQIVRSYGRGIGKKRNASSQYPKFETYREQIDGKYWFPTYTSSSDTLMFENGPVPIKLTIKYTDYKRFGAESDIKFGDAVEEAPAPPKPPKPNN
jgi:hypothetical protein